VTERFLILCIWIYYNLDFMDVDVNFVYYSFSYLL
jgi:hypothetical protein